MLVQQQVQTLCSLPSHKGVQVCFWCGGAFNGERFFLVMPNCDTSNMSVFLKELSKSYNDDMWDSSLWWSSMAQIKEFRNFGKHHNDTYTTIYTRNESHWTNLRQMGFGNKIFSTLKAVVDRLCDTINLLTDELVKSITLREWIYSVI